MKEERKEKIKESHRECELKTRLLANRKGTFDSGVQHSVTHCASAKRTAGAGLPRGSRQPPQCPLPATPPLQGVRPAPPPGSPSPKSHTCAGLCAATPIRPTPPTKSTLARGRPAGPASGEADERESGDLGALSRGRRPPPPAEPSLLGKVSAKLC